MKILTHTVNQLRIITFPKGSNLNTCIVYQDQLSLEYNILDVSEIYLYDKKIQDLVNFQIKQEMTAFYEYTNMVSVIVLILKQGSEMIFPIATTLEGRGHTLKTLLHIFK